MFAAAETTFFNAAYVPRGDVTHVNALTVRQVLRYAAYLRRTDQAEISSVDLLRSHYSGEGYVKVSLLRLCYVHIQSPFLFFCLA
jgi:hypothetical protein